MTTLWVRKTCFQNPVSFFPYSCILHYPCLFPTCHQGIGDCSCSSPASIITCPQFSHLHLVCSIHCWPHVGPLPVPKCPALTLGPGWNSSAPQWKQICVDVSPHRGGRHCHILLGPLSLSVILSVCERLQAPWYLHQILWPSPWGDYARISCLQMYLCRARSWGAENMVHLSKISIFNCKTFCSVIWDIS